MIGNFLAISCFLEPGRIAIIFFSLLIPREAFISSGKNSEVINGTIYYKTASGSVTTRNLLEEQNKIQDQELTNKLEVAKRNKDYNTWYDLKKAQYSDLEKSIKNADPVLDQLDVLKWKNKQADIIAEVSKYQSYGGSFTKPKKAKKVKKASIKKVSVKLPRLSTSGKRVSTPKVKAPKEKSMKVKLAKVTIKQPKR